ncbi:MAG: biotin synthase BioB [Verrucomicrobiota bacterium]|nr:biotin synthase BioB [Verrucomicrobiota bacterium]
MPLDFARLARDACAGRVLSRQEAMGVLTLADSDFPTLFDAAWSVRRHFHGNRVQIQVLSNAKSGLCGEDCRYCAQSRVSHADIERYPIKSVEALLKDARQAGSLRARRFCMGLSGRVLEEEEAATLCDAIRRIKAEVGIPVCCSLGFLTPEQARRLREAGLDRVNHNLNTSERFYPSICTTHTFADRMRNLEICRDTGLELCSGGIVGQGETDADIVDMLLALRKVAPASVPINFLVPIPGTPFGDAIPKLTPLKCLKILGLARLLHPSADIRVAGGREAHLRALQPMSLFIANSIFVNGYLTATGQPCDEALSMISDAGFELEVENAAAGPE